MGSVSFLASPSVLLVLAVFTAFGNLTALTDTLTTVGLKTTYTAQDVQIHLFATLTIFVLSFFSFTLALRQFNHFCILLGAIEHSEHVAPDEIDGIAQLNTLAAKNLSLIHISASCTATLANASGRPSEKSSSRWMPL